METAMSNKARNTAGKFAPKSEVPRKVRSVNLTDDAWQWLAATAEAAGMSRNDYLEALADGNNPLMETASAAPPPLIETVESEAEVSGAEIAGLPIDKDIPLIETVEVEIESLKQELAAARTDYAKLLETSSHIKASREKEIAELRSQLATERADREEVEAELSDLKQNSAPASSKDLPEAADLLNRLKAKRKKSAVTLADVEALLGMIEG
jgi:DNA repair exonuclease SbcCD ATPase subunit